MKKIIIGVIAIVVLVLGGWWFFGQNNQAPVTQTIAPEKNLPMTAETKVYEIIYTDAGFSPSTLTVKAGDTVTFKNQSSGGMWVGSAMHPTHIVYSGTSLKEHCPDDTNASFDECQSVSNGESWSFTFTKIGTWGYHNHANASKFGKVVVD